MAEVQFRPRYALSSVRNPDLPWLEDLILDPFRPGREFGEATISFSDYGRKIDMILITDPTLGYYLKYDAGHSEWLSLGNPSRLSEVVCPDDWHASAGLFIPPDQAWLAISEFCQTGKRSNASNWISPRDIPADGNY
jgi:hypothetical protein